MTPGGGIEKPANRDPVFDANLDTTLEVLENGGGGVNLDSSATATDPDKTRHVHLLSDGCGRHILRNWGLRGPCSPYLSVLVSYSTIP